MDLTFMFSVYIILFFRMGYILFPAIYHPEQEISSQGCLWLIQWSEWPFLKFVNTNGSKLAFPVIWQCPHQIHCNKLKRFGLFFFFFFYVWRDLSSNLLNHWLSLLQIDEEILQDVVKMGFDRIQLIESLRNRMQNEVWTLIDLLKLVLYTILRYGLITYHAFFRLLLLTICYWTIDFVFPMAILELSSKKLWCVWFPSLL